jgi:hypothetical protein
LNYPKHNKIFPSLSRYPSDLFPIDPDMTVIGAMVSQILDCSSQRTFFLSP